MYDTFKDKRRLFLAALDRFEEMRVSRTNEILDGSPSAGEGIRRLFETSVEGLVGYEPRRGCLLANTAVELAPHDEEWPRGSRATWAVLRRRSRRRWCAGAPGARSPLTRTRRPAPASR
jgi:AcrR family transcriptional regulator